MTELGCHASLHIMHTQAPASFTMGPKIFQQPPGHFIPNSGLYYIRVSQQSWPQSTLWLANYLAGTQSDPAADEVTASCPTILMEHQSWLRHAPQLTPGTHQKPRTLQPPPGCLASTNTTNKTSMSCWSWLGHVPQLHPDTTRDQDYF